MSKYTWDESPKRDRVYLEHIDVSNVHFYAVAYACLQHSGGWVGLGNTLLGLGGSASPVSILWKKSSASSKPQWSYWNE